MFKNHVILRICSWLLVFCFLCQMLPVWTRAEEQEKPNTKAKSPSATVSEVDELFTARSWGQHPRILANEDDFARVRKLLQTDDYMKVWYTRILNYCESQLAEPLPSYPAEGGTILGISRTASYRITGMAFLYQITGERRFADRAVEEMLAVSAFPTWHPESYLDVAQMAYGVGIGYDWLYHYMTASERAQISKALYNLAIVSSQTKWSYMTSRTNWNPWCHAGVSIAACAIYEDYSTDCSDYLSKAVTRIQTAMNVMTPMGAYPEGTDYYVLGVGFMTVFFETLFSVLGTDFGLSDMDGIREAGNYLMALNGNVVCFNYGDANASLYNTALLHWFANRFNEPQWSVYQRERQTNSVFYDEYLAMLWYNPELVESISRYEGQLDYLVYSDHYQSVASFRSFEGDGREIYAAIKSGWNGTSHADMDVGTFVLDAMGERWFDDLGKDNYDLTGEYTGNGYKETAKRWSCYSKRAEGQNTLVLNPSKLGGQGADAKCQITAYESAYDGGYASVDMLDAYDSYGASSATRSLLLFDNRSRVLLRDELVCTKTSELYWFAHTRANITLSADKKTAELTLNGKTLLAQIAAPSNATFSVMAAESLPTSSTIDGQRTHEDVQKLAIHLNNITSAKISVVFTPVLQESDRSKTLPTTSIAELSTLLDTYAPATKLPVNAEGEYEISNAEQLMYFAKEVNSGNSFSGKTVKLTNDIDLKGRSLTPIGGCGTGKHFAGTFDGGNHCIKNLVIFKPDQERVAVFGQCNKATIRNLGIESGIVFGGGITAGLVGLGGHVTIDNCYNKATVISTGNTNGGISAQLSGVSTITNCYNNASILGSGSKAGGMVAYVSGSTDLMVQNCYHVGNLTDSIGRTGLIGFYNTEEESLLVSSIKLSNCYSTAPIKSSAVTDNESLESISDCKQISLSELPSVAISLGSGFVYDCEGENDGYPVLAWQCSTKLPEDLVFSTAAELRRLAYEVNSGKSTFSGQTLKLARDIDLDFREWIPIGGNSTSDTSRGKIFKGTFDGQGYSVKNMNITSGRSYVGFFGSVQGTVKNFGIESGRIVGFKKVAGLSGYFSGTMENCYNKASINANSQSGGLIGVPDGVTVTNCYNTAPITAKLIAGGLFGWFTEKSSGSTITACYNSGPLSGSTVGALAASVSTSVTDISFINCYALNSNSLVGADVVCTLTNCGTMSASSLKSSDSKLGKGYIRDGGLPTNGGYPILLRRVYAGPTLPALRADANGVYEISDARELRAFSYMVNAEGNTFAGKTIRLNSDIDLENEEWIPIGGNLSSNGMVSPYFAGTFDGGGHKIRNLCVSSGNLYVGLFGFVSGGTIRNVGVESGMIIGTEAVGGIVGSTEGKTLVEACYNKATVGGTTAVGGIVGKLGTLDTTVENCYNTGYVSGQNSQGGIVGLFAGNSKNVLVRNCYNAGTGCSSIVGTVHADATGAKLEHCVSLEGSELCDTPNGLQMADCVELSLPDLRGYSTNLTDAFAEDYFVQNEMLPVLAWENQGRTSSLRVVDGVYQIKCADDLRLLSYTVRKGTTYSGKKLELRADIDLEDKAWLPIGGYDGTKYYYFKGSFDGRGYTISNIYVNTTNNYIGLFGLTNGASIKNIGIDSGAIIGYDNVGGIIGSTGANTTISDCYNKATVVGNNYIGGITGQFAGKNCVMENCYNVGHISGKNIGNCTGGLIGRTNASTTDAKIRNCYNVGHYYGIISIASATATGTVENCYAVGGIRPIKTQSSLSVTETMLISGSALREYVPVLGSAFDEDREGKNEGYPVLAWESGKVCFHEYVISSNGEDSHITACFRCGDSTTESHKWNEGSTVTNPGCDASGSKEYICTTCGHRKTESIGATGHSYTYKVKEKPTVSTAGSLTGTCSVCSVTITVTVPKLNDTDYAKTSTKAPTCTEKGTDSYRWKITTYGTFTFTATTAALGHTYNEGEVTVKSTLTEKGVKTFTCRNESTHTYTEELDILHKSLFFDFDNGVAASDRYQNYVYGYCNFDTEEAWRGRTQGYKEGNLSLDPDIGTLTVTPIKTGYGSIYADSVNLDLNYDPDYAEYFQMRFKVTGLSGQKAKATIHFYYDTDNSYVAATSVSFDPVYLDSGEYIVVTGKIQDAVRELEEINRVILHVGSFTAPADTNGVLTFDYAFIGPYEELPMKKSVFFDFTDNGKDSIRYNSRTYGYTNFDDLSELNWSYSTATVSGLVSDSVNDTITIRAKGTIHSTTWPAVYMDTYSVAHKNAYPLEFVTSEAEYFQIRFKMKNFRIGETETTNDDGSVTTKIVSPYVKLSFTESGGTTSNAGTGDYRGHAEYINSDTWITATIPVNSAIVSADEITRLRIYFGGVESISDSELGEITIDYVFVGPYEELPTKDSLYFDFTDTEEDQFRYNSRTYTYTNFDDLSKLNWYYPSSVVKELVPDSANHTITIRVNGVIDPASWPGVYMDTCSNGDKNSYPLKFDPREAEYFQIRFKMKNLRVGETETVNEDGSVTTKVINPYLKLSFTEAGSTATTAGTGDYKGHAAYVNTDTWIVATVPLNSAFKSATEITRIRLYFGGVESISEAELGEITIDYAFIGKLSDLPTPAYTVTFVDGKGNVLATQLVNRGENATYTGKAPTKAADETNHYTFKGWDKALTNITADTTITATFTAVAHSYTYDATDTAEHKGTCSCGYRKTESHSYTYKATKNPTTSASGTLTGTCSKCNGTTSVTLPKLNTTDYTKTTTKAPTCTATGTDKYTWKTTTYGSFSFNATTAAKGHTSVTDKAVAPTCTATGLTEGKHCSVCNEVLTAQTTVAALGHDYKAVVTAPTCGAEGYTTHTCSRCGHSYVDSKVSATGHSYTYKATKNPTTSATGTLTGTCSACSTTTTVSLPKLNTTDYTKTTTKAPTCTATGTDKYTWKTTTYGSFYFNVTTKAKGHTSVADKAVDPTCTATGLTAGAHCSVCNAVLTAQEVVPAKGHTEVTDKAVAPTCTATGLTEGKHCSVCNAVLISQDKVPALGHAYDRGAVTTEPTFTQRGIKTYTCANDEKHTYTEELAVLTKSLFFDFNNSTQAKERYQNYVYNYHSFDTVEAWRGRTQGYKNGSQIMDTTTGTLTVTPGVTGFTSIYADSVNFDLNYDPDYAEVFQMRFKIAGLTGEKAKASVYFYYTKGSTYVAAPAEAFDVSYLGSDTYVLVTGTVTDEIRALEEINRVVLHISGFTAPEDLNATVTFDYAFVGPYEELPNKDNLFFDFTNTEIDCARYNNRSYGYVQYDRAENWKYPTATVSHISMDNMAGTATIHANGTFADKTWPAVYMDTYDAQSGNSYPLVFHPVDAEYVQIRFKLKNFRPGDQTTVSDDGSVTLSTKSPYASLNFSADGSTSSVAATANFKAFGDKIDADTWIVATMPLNDAFKNAETIQRLRLYFGGIESISEDRPGEVTIDYVFVGKLRDLPTPAYTVTFVDHTGAVLATQLVNRGEDATYTGKTPKKSYDDTYHYSFEGWDKELTGIKGDTTITATYTATAHSCTYTAVDPINHGASCSCGYSKTEVHTYVNGICICGEPEIKEPIQQSTWKLGHTLNLASDISVNIAIQKASLAGFDLDTVYVESQIAVYDGNEFAGVKTIRLEPVDNGNYYYFTVSGLTAVQMNNTITSVLYGTKNGQAYYSPTDTYSIATYAYSQLNKVSVPATLKTLCADLLRYGSKAQIYKGYRTDALADSAMSDTHRAYLSDIDSVTFGNTNLYLNDLENAPVAWVGKSLNLDSKVELKFIFSIKSYSGDLADLNLQVAYTDVKGNPKTATVDHCEVYNEKLGYYAFTLDALLAAELRSVVSAQIYAGETPVSCTLQYTADTYGKNKTGALGDLCKALFAYSDSAKAYFKD